MPEISVIMGIYNEKKQEQVKLAINSILQQTFSDLEFIICDDGSAPEHYNWLQEYCKKDDRILLLRHRENQGLSQALNTCLKRASGKYIARMDADDISKPDRFRKQWEYLEEHSDVAMVGTGVELIHSEGCWGQRIPPLYPQKEDFLLICPFIHPTVMVRREVYQNLGGYSVETYAERTEDYELFMRMYAQGYQAVNLPELLLQYREDMDAYQKRKYRYRIHEYQVRKRGFRLLGIQKHHLHYVIKPLVIGLIPAWGMRMIKRIQYKR